MIKRMSVPAIGERILIRSNHSASETIHPEYRIAPIHATVKGYGERDDGIPTLMVRLEDGRPWGLVFMYQLERDESFYDQYRPFSARRTP